MSARPPAVEILKGVASYVPGLLRLRQALLPRLPEATRTLVLSRYCYSVWLRHMVMAGQNGLASPPHALLELGPGSSLGVGVAALLSGTDTYFALDVVPLAERQTNLKLLGELTGLYSNRESIPGNDEFPLLEPVVDSLAFPGEILTEERMRSALNPSRLNAVYSALSETPADGELVEIGYLAPWGDPAIVRPESMDMVLAQAVMQYVPDVEQTCRDIYGWLRPGGLASLTIDYTAHGVAKTWDGHWGYSEHIWRLVRGNRPHFLNRQPHSAYISALRRAGFEISCEIRTVAEPQIPRSDLANTYRSITEADRQTHSSYILALRPEGPQAGIL